MPIGYLVRRERFCASHRLNNDSFSEEENRRIFGKCNNLNGHGHNYELWVTVRGEINLDTGMVMNLSELKEVVNTQILLLMDHKHLNLDVPFLEGINPTAENVVVAIWQRLLPHLPPGMLFEVKLFETENNVAIYRGE